MQHEPPSSDNRSKGKEEGSKASKKGSKKISEHSGREGNDLYRGIREIQLKELEQDEEIAEIDFEALEEIAHLKYPAHFPIKLAIDWDDFNIKASQIESIGILLGKVMATVSDEELSEHKEWIPPTTLIISA